MPIPIIDTSFSNTMIFLILGITLLLSIRASTVRDTILPTGITEELKGFSILAILFAHIGYILVSDSQFLYPLSIFAGVGVDIFLWLSGYGLTISMMKRPIGIWEFYRRRLFKILIPFWIALGIILLMDAMILQKTYTLHTIISAIVGWFPRADVWSDINSPLWYMSWILGMYMLFPIFFMRKRIWLTVILLAICANLFAFVDPFKTDTNWLYRLHTIAFPLGVLSASWIQQYKEQFFTTIQHLKFSWRYGIMIALMIFIGYFSTHADTQSWQGITSQLTMLGLDAKSIITQSVSLLMMICIIVVFVLKNHDIRLFSIFGIFSYEIYLIHWPLLSRYDVFFHHFPAWIALILWLGMLLGLGWVGQWFNQKFSPQK